MLKRNSEVLVNNEKYKDVKGVITDYSLQVVYEITNENGKIFHVPAKELTVVKEGNDE